MKVLGLFLALIFTSPQPTLTRTHGGNYDLINPLLKTIEARIECEGFSPLIVIVPPRTTEEVILSDSRGVELAFCRMVSFAPQRDL